MTRMRLPLSEVVPARRSWARFSIRRRRGVQPIVFWPRRVALGHTSKRPRTTHGVGLYARTRSPTFAASRLEGLCQASGRNFFGNESEEF